MKTRTFLIAMTTCALLATGVHALTRQWGVPAGQIAFSILADGKGGCAFAIIETNGAYAVVWVDSKGAVKYQKELPAGTSASTVKCLKKTFVYITYATTGNTLVQVDKNGQEMITSEPGKTIATSGLPQISDKKGLFAIVTDTNQTPVRAELVRYSDK
jgi:hypothetical protein